MHLCEKYWKTCKYMQNTTSIFKYRYYKTILYLEIYAIIYPKTHAKS